MNTINPTTGDTRSWRQAMLRGVLARCPRCGQGPMFGRLLKVQDECAVCCLELHHHRTDDAPPYISMMIMGHILAPLVLMLERAAQPPIWLHLSLWLPLTLIMTLLLLPRVKGALIGLQWANRMHGFGGDPG